MNNKLHNLIDIFDIGDLSFFILLAKKNIKIFMIMIITMFWGLQMLFQLI